MIKNPEKLRQVEEEFLRKEELTVEEKFAIMESLYREAVALGHFTEDDLYEGLDEKIEFVRKLHMKDVRNT